jgi:hypothetical protein
MEKISIAFFLRFADYEYLKQLQSEGIVYCNTQTRFNDSSLNSIQFDEIEGYTHKIPIENITIYDAKGGNIIGKDSSQDARLFGNISEGFRNIYSLYSIMVPLKFKNIEDYISDEMKANYEYFLLIKNPKEFLNRLDNEIKNRGYKYETGLIEYKDFANAKIVRTFFEKDISHRDENEFRVLIYNDVESHIELKIGSISDISIIEKI